MEDNKARLAAKLLETTPYIEMTEEQEELVVEYETEKLKPKVDELKAIMTKDRIIEEIHEWWLGFEIADGTEKNLIRYLAE